MTLDLGYGIQQRLRIVILDIVDILHTNNDYFVQLRFELSSE